MRFERLSSSQDGMLITGVLSAKDEVAEKLDIASERKQEIVDARAQVTLLLQRYTELVSGLCQSFPYFD